MEDRRVGVIRGGNTLSNKSSLQNGGTVLALLADTGYDTRDIVITAAGEWLVDGYVKLPASALANVDVVFIALQDAFSQYSQVQRVLDRLHIPYTGSGALPASVAANKLLTKTQAEALGIKTPKHLLIHRTNASDIHRLAHTITELFMSDVVIKPQYSSGSLDTYTASPFTPLAPLLEDILSRHETILVEERLRGKEATVGILERYRNETTYTFPPVEVQLPEESGYFSAELKQYGGATLACPGRFSQLERDELMQTAQVIHRQLGLEHYSRSDFMVTPDGVYFLETNALPEITSESPYVAGFSAVGGSPRELVTHLLSLANISS